MSGFLLVFALAATSAARGRAPARGRLLGAVSVKATSFWGGRAGLDQLRSVDELLGDLARQAQRGEPVEAFLPSCEAHLSGLAADVDAAVTDAQLEPTLLHECELAREFPRTHRHGYASYAACQKFSRDIAAARASELNQGHTGVYQELCAAYYQHLSDPSWMDQPSADSAAGQPSILTDPAYPTPAQPRQRVWPVPDPPAARTVRPAPAPPAPVHPPLAEQTPAQPSLAPPAPLEPVSAAPATAPPPATDPAPAQAPPVEQAPAQPPPAAPASAQPPPAVLATAQPPPGGQAPVQPEAGAPAAAQPPPADQTPAQPPLGEAGAGSGGGGGGNDGLTLEEQVDRETEEMQKSIERQNGAFQPTPEPGQPEPASGQPPLPDRAPEQPQADHEPTLHPLPWNQAQAPLLPVEPVPATAAPLPWHQAERPLQPFKELGPDYLAPAVVPVARQTQVQGKPSGQAKAPPRLSTRAPGQPQAPGQQSITTDPAYLAPAQPPPVDGGAGEGGDGGGGGGKAGDVGRKLTAEEQAQKEMEDMKRSIDRELKTSKEPPLVDVSSPKGLPRGDGVPDTLKLRGGVRGVQWG